MRAKHPQRMSLDTKPVEQSRETGKNRTHGGIAIQ